MAPQITPFPTGRIVSAFYQAFHAWLPLFRPSGTKVSFLKLTLMRAESWGPFGKKSDERLSYSLLPFRGVRKPLSGIGLATCRAVGFAKAEARPLQWVFTRQ